MSFVLCSLLSGFICLGIYFWPCFLCCCHLSKDNLFPSQRISATESVHHLVAKWWSSGLSCITGMFLSNHYSKTQPWKKTQHRCSPLKISKSLNIFVQQWLVMGLLSLVMNSYFNHMNPHSLWKNKCYLDFQQTLYSILACHSPAPVLVGFSCWLSAASAHHANKSRLPAPERHDGNHKDVLCLPNQVLLTFELQPSSFPTGRSHIAYLISQ